jgi:hypothetical protein
MLDAAGNEIPGTLKEGEVAVLKTELDTLSALRARYTPPAEGKYELAIPDKDTALTLGHTEKTAALAAKLGLSNDLAKELVPFLDTTLKEQATRFAAENAVGGTAWKVRSKEWQAQILADTELGGTPEKLAEHAELGRRVVDAFFPPEMKAFLDDTGFGNHPAVFKGFLKLGRLMAEGKVLPVGKPPGNDKKSSEEVFYGEPLKADT